MFFVQVLVNGQLNRAVFQGRQHDSVAQRHRVVSFRRGRDQVGTLPDRISEIGDNEAVSGLSVMLIGNREILVFDLGKCLI